MSRRAKLLIAALFLVLLAIPAVYAVLTWSPQNPLRFHVREVPPIPPLRLLSEDSQKAEVLVRVAVENMSAIPVKLLRAHIKTPEELSMPRRDSGRINLDVQFTGQSLMGAVPANIEEMLVPAHGTLEVWAMVNQEVLPQAGSGRLFVHYWWMSRTKAAADDVSVWLRVHPPEWLHPHVPLIDDDEDDTPLTAGRVGER